MFTLNCKGRLLVLDKPVIMGIINTTSDSFYSGSRQQTIDQVLRKAEQMLREGATMVDIGGQSTRPGSEQISVDEELRRVTGVVAAIRQAFPDAFISVDTYYSRVAEETVAAGADMINDVSAGGIDTAMFGTVAALKVPYVLMHMQGTPQTMQQQAVYENVTREVLDFFIQKTRQLQDAGIHDIIIDPGFGFGKTIAHNFTLLRELSAFSMLGYPILTGISRKSTIYKTLGVSPEEALNGTTVLNTLALENGASILRVHDVKEACEVVRLWDAYRGCF